MKADFVEPFAVNETFVDGFCDYQIMNGIFSCAGYRLQKPCTGGDPVKVVVIRIVMPLASANESNSRTRKVILAEAEMVMSEDASRH